MNANASSGPTGPAPAAGDDTAPDCVVVGAGPAGLLAALLLGRRGRRVTVLERRPDPAGAAPAAGGSVIVQPVTLGLLDQAGLLTAASAGAGRMLGAEAYFGGTLAGSYRYEELPASPVPYALSLRPGALLGGMLAALDALPNVTLVWGAEVESLGGTPGGTRTLTVRTPGGTREYRPAYLLAADGRDSATRALAGIPAEVTGSGGGYLDAGVPIPPGWDELTRAHFGAHGYLLETRRGEDGLVIVWITDAAAAAAVLDGPVEGLVKVWSDVVPRLAGWFARHITDWDQVRRVQHHSVRARTWSAGNVVLLGDSAHGMHAFAGQGMNTSLQDAVCLTDAVDQALTGQDTGGFDAFERIRRPYIEALQNLQATNTPARADQAAPERERAPEFEVLALGQPEIRPLLARAAAHQARYAAANH
ncbi:FAD-dependent monooxygenase [Streptomyces sp. NBC_01622]|uniref:FAD-dependent oxidoreductase n=1 Tax=Streptomyces sp. NBC_01622 TaxID=2975903 RepID=UPI00386907F0|nr:FAD-dependent monooxygenase [Streptomyces sp. NBC_01622]